MTGKLNIVEVEKPSALAEEGTDEKKEKAAKTDKPKKVAAKPKAEAPKAAKAGKPAAPKKVTAVKTGSSRGK